MGGLEVRSVSPGWTATIVRDDGTAVSFWGPTERRARERAFASDQETPDVEALLADKEVA